MGRPRRSAARDTRRLILDAAVDLLSDRGARGTSMRALAAAVGLRESALYHHFSSKDELLREALAAPEPAAATALEGPAAGVTASYDFERPLEEIFLAMAQELAHSFGSPRRRKQLRALLSAGGSTDEDPWRLLAEEPRRRLARVLQRLRRAGRVREELDLDVVHMHFLAPVLFATGVLAPGKKPPIAIPLQRFLQAHAALLAQALAPLPKRRAH